MKSQVLALLVASVAADAPPFFNEPPMTETHPAAAGLVQTSSCMQAGVSGVTCGPSDEELFATGMNGDEDLGEDITMKGDKFHYNQELAQISQVPTGDKVEVRMNWYDKPACTGTNGPVWTNCRPRSCNGTNGPKDGPAQAGHCYRDYQNSIPKYDSNPTQGRPYETTGDQTITYGESYHNMWVQLDAEKIPEDLSEPEKVDGLWHNPQSMYRTTYF